MQLAAVPDGEGRVLTDTLTRCSGRPTGCIGQLPKLIVDGWPPVALAPLPQVLHDAHGINDADIATHTEDRIKYPGLVGWQPAKRDAAWSTPVAEAALRIAPPVWTPALVHTC